MHHSTSLAAPLASEAVMSPIPSYPRPLPPSPALSTPSWFPPLSLQLSNRFSNTPLLCSHAGWTLSYVLLQVFFHITPPHHSDANSDGIPDAPIDRFRPVSTADSIIPIVIHDRGPSFESDLTFQTRIPGSYTPPTIIFSPAASRSPYICILSHIRPLHVKHIQTQHDIEVQVFNQ